MVNGLLVSHKYTIQLGQWFYWRATKRLRWFLEEAQNSIVEFHIEIHWGLVT